MCKLEQPWTFIGIICFIMPFTNYVGVFRNRIEIKFIRRTRTETGVELFFFKNQMGTDSLKIIKISTSGLKM